MVESSTNLPQGDSSSTEPNTFELTPQGLQVNSFLETIETFDNSTDGQGSITMTNPLQGTRNITVVESI